MTSKYLDSLIRKGIIDDYELDLEVDDERPQVPLWYVWLPKWKRFSQAHTSLGSASEIKEDLSWIEDCEDKDCEVCNESPCPDDCTIHAHNDRRIKKES